MKAVVFDLDDTLISEHEFMMIGYRAVSKHLEELLPDIWQDIYERLIKLSEESPGNIFNRLLDTYHLYYDEDDIFNVGHPAAVSEFFNNIILII